MIARTWRGSVRRRDAETYLDYLRRTGFAEYHARPGHLATLGLRRLDADRAEFLLVTLWSSMEAVRGFAGDDPEQAVFYPADERFLVDRDQHARHFEAVFADGLALRMAGPAGGDGGPGAANSEASSRAHRLSAWRHLPGGARAALGWWWRGYLAFVAQITGGTARALASS